MSQSQNENEKGSVSELINSKIQEKQIVKCLKDELNYLIRQEIEWKLEVDPKTISSLKYLIQLYSDTTSLNNPTFLEENQSEDDKKVSKAKREQQIQQLREALNNLLQQDLVSSEVDPNKISSLIHLSKVYEEQTLPKGFEPEQFLDRFYERNSIGPYRNSHKPFHKYLVQWKKRNDPKLKPLKRKAYLYTVMIILLTVNVFRHSIYAEGKKEVFQVQKYAKDSILFQKKNLRLLQHPSKNFNDNLEEDTNSTKIPAKYQGKIYLPIELLESFPDYQVYEIGSNGKEELKLKFIFDDITKWFDMLIYIGAGLEINYNSGNNDILQDDFCCWNNARIYLNEKTNITTIIFEIESNFYFISSNIPKEELIEIVNHMEEYK